MVHLTRSAPRRPGRLSLGPDRGETTPAAFDGVDAVVHLAGETVACHWIEAKNGRTRDSRVLGTRALAQGSGRASDPRPRCVRVRICDRRRRRSR